MTSSGVTDSTQVFAANPAPPAPVSTFPDSACRLEQARVSSICAYARVQTALSSAVSAGAAFGRFDPFPASPGKSNAIFGFPGPELVGERPRIAAGRHFVSRARLGPFLVTRT